MSQKQLNDRTSDREDHTVSYCVTHNMKQASKIQTFSKEQNTDTVVTQPCRGCCCGRAFFPLSPRFWFFFCVALPLFFCVSFFILGSTCLYLPFTPAGRFALFDALNFFATTYET